MQIEEGKFYRTRDNRRVGPMENWLHSLRDNAHNWRQKGGSHLYCKGGDVWRGDGTSGYHGEEGFLISEWVNGPVRTVIRKEIEPGHYGLIRINGACMSRKEVSWFVDGSWTTAKQIREAINTLGEIADALEDQK